MSADTLFRGVRILADGVDLTGDLLVRDGRIVALGSNASMAAWGGAKTRIHDLQGRTVIPGLIDSHMHAIRAALSYATEVHWIGVNSLEQALARLKTAADKAAQEAAIRAQLGTSTSTSKSAKKSTITCIKGKLIKKVTAVNPKCPSGYKKK